jgi:putative endonuclease
MTGWIYIMSNRPNGVLYVGVTSDLARRVYEHREGIYRGFTQSHNLKMLIYYEHYDDIRQAIQREKNIKHWSRSWKVQLIHTLNPTWRDLYDDLA